MLHRLCGPPSIPLSFSLATVLPGGMLNALAPARRGSIPTTPSIHRLGPGLPGYLIPFATLAFAPQRQDRARMPPSPRVFLQISTHFTATPGIPHPSPGFKPFSFGCSSRVEPGFHNRLERQPTSPLRPVNPNNACPPRITAAAGTELAGASSSGTVKPAGYWPAGSSSRSTGVYNPKVFVLHAALRRQAFAHCEQFPTAASRRSLGRISVPVWPSALSGRLPIVALVSRYPTNKLIGRGSIFKHRVRRSPALIAARPRAGCHAVLAFLSKGYPPLEGRSPTRYSPVCHSTRGPKVAFAFDLHV